MATALRSPSFRAPQPGLSATSLKPPKSVCLSYKQRCFKPLYTTSPCSALRLSKRLLKFVPSASQGEATETEELQESEIEENSNDAVSVEDSSSEDDTLDSESEEKMPDSAITASLKSYKEALAKNDESKVAELEAFIKSIEDEKTDLERKLTILNEELSVEKERILRISADFDNFRKRTEREKLSLVSNAQGEVVENLLPVLDNFERAKAQIKVETEGEEKINNSYQSIYKQFLEILGSLGVVPVETVGNPFDPLLHEAIMREDSSEYEEGIIIQEFRKGFKLGERLLRPAMVKVSAGPGPKKPEPEESKEEEDSAGKSSEEASTEGSA